MMVYKKMDLLTMSKDLKNIINPKTYFVIYDERTYQGLVIKPPVGNNAIKLLATEVIEKKAYNKLVRALKSILDMSISDGQLENEAHNVAELALKEVGEVVGLQGRTFDVVIEDD